MIDDDYDIEVPVIFHETLDRWVKFMKNDSAIRCENVSMLFILKPENQPIKVTCCTTVAIIEKLSDIDFVIERALYAMQSGDQ